MILSVTLNPCVDQTLFLENLQLHDRNKVDRQEVDAGGKGVNLSRIVAELGGKTTATGFLGGDNGTFIRSVLAREEVEDAFVQISGRTRSNISLETGDGSPTVISINGPNITKEEWDSFLVIYEQLCSKAKWVCLGGSLTEGIPASAYFQLTEKAKNCGSRVLLDADRAFLESGLKAGPDLIKPNAHEATRLLGSDIKTKSDALSATKELFETLCSHGSQSPVAIVSMGEIGAAMTCEQGSFFANSVKVKVCSTIGSGDSMLGAMVYRNSLGDPWETCLRWGIAAGAATAESDGTSVGKLAEILRLFELASVQRAETM